MAKKGPDKKRRQFLTQSAVVIGGAGVMGSSIPFAASMLPSERAKNQGAPVEVDISKLEPGQLLIFEWRKAPIWVLRRTPEMLANLKVTERRLVDPHSDVDEQQPPYARNPHRSIKPEFLVLNGFCTHLSCTPNFRPEFAIREVGDWWKGGFYCPCHRSWYDLAGRVFENVPAPKNLLVPPHHYVSDTVILIGENPKV